MKRIFIIALLLFLINLTYAQTVWVKDNNNPVLDVGLPGSWESWRVNHHEVYYDGTTYRMWYTGETNPPNRVGNIGLATSIDGISWTKYTNNPVMTGSGSGIWDSVSVFTPVVIHNGNEFEMWYSGGAIGFVEIGYATSQDGISWTKYSENPVMTISPGNWDATYVVPCEVIYEDSTYKMWYASGDQSVPIQVGYATSPDGINWTKYSGNPVLEPGANGSWDDVFVYTPDIVYADTTYYMWYMGFDGSFLRIGNAASQDGINWAKHSENPTMDVGAIGSWDEIGVGHPRVIYDGTDFQMWFFGNDGSNIRIGHATSTVSDLADEGGVKPEIFMLEQNYPNPFNPTTTIRYSLSKATLVKLAIYNLLGHEIKTLVYDMQAAGQQAVAWDGTDNSGKAVTTGLYVYRLSNGSMHQSKKMLLLR